MRLTNGKHRSRLRGMTLIEIIIAMVVIILVTIIAYIGVSTASGLIQYGKDLRDADSAAVSAMERQIEDSAANPDAATTDIVNYSVQINSKVTGVRNSADSEGNPVTEMYAVTDEYLQESVVTGPVVTDGMRVRKVAVTEGIIEYDIYLPPATLEQGS